MTKTSYTVEDIDKLKQSRNLLNKTATEKYQIYKSKDPFPQIGEALLNSADLLMYLLTVGIVEPFDEKNLKGVTYQCTFSGEAHRFDSETGGMEEIRLTEESELVLERNSITYLKIEEKFHVPEYMVLRFNLSVSNAYKGLLLGTGPIVDPGFEGNLFIPLHNLTGNEYIIKKGAPLIRVEFTKLSHHADWGNKKGQLFPGLHPITKKTPQNASFSSFIEEALLDSDKKQFYTKGGVVSVRSSIPDVIADSADKAKQAQDSAKRAEKAARRWTLAGTLGGVITIAAVLLSVFSLVSDTNSRYDGMTQEIEVCNQVISDLTQQLEETKAQIKQLETAQYQDSKEEISAALSDETDEFASLVTSDVNG